MNSRTLIAGIMFSLVAVTAEARVHNFTCEGINKVAVVNMKMVSDVSDTKWKSIIFNNHYAINLVTTEDSIYFKTYEWFKTKQWILSKHGSVLKNNLGDEYLCLLTLK